MALYLAPVYFNFFSPHPSCSKGFSVFLVVFTHTSLRSMLECEFQLNYR